MTMKRPSDVVRTHGVSQAGLRQKLKAVERRIRDAETIGWPALAESWRRDAQPIRDRLAQATPARSHG